MSINLPTFESYGHYASDNYGAHALRFWLPNGVSIWFSYETPIAFSTPNVFRVRQNEWGSTTGKHLNWIDGDNKKDRIPGEQFERELAALFTDNEEPKP